VNAFQESKGVPGRLFGSPQIATFKPDGGQALPQFRYIMFRHAPAAANESLRCKALRLPQVAPHVSPPKHQPVPSPGPLWVLTQVHYRREASTYDLPLPGLGGDLGSQQIEFHSSSLVGSQLLLF
jgi:hypothetical protein